MTAYITTYAISQHLRNFEISWSNLYTLVGSGCWWLLHKKSAAIYYGTIHNSILISEMCTVFIDTYYD